MYEFRGRPLARCLLGPLADPAVTLGTLGVGFLVCLAVGRLAAIVGILLFVCFLVSFELPAYTASLQADASGVGVRNVLVRYRIPWGEVSAIWAREPGRLGQKIVIEKRHRTSVVGLLLDPITAYASVASPRDAQVEAARALVALAGQHGFDVRGGSAQDMARQKVAGYERGEI